MTFARMGRSMKNREIMPGLRYGRAGAAAAGGPLLFDRCHLGAGPGALDPADHDPVVGLEALPRSPASR